MARPKKDKNELSVKRSVSFTAEQFERLEKYAKREERQISWCIRKALDEWLEDKGV